MKDGRWVYGYGAAVGHDGTVGQMSDCVGSTSSSSLLFATLLSVPEKRYKNTTTSHNAPYNSCMLYVCMNSEDGEKGRCGSRYSPVLRKTYYSQNLNQESKMLNAKYDFGI